jgi:hypothetical protein
MPWPYLTKRVQPFWANLFLAVCFLIVPGLAKAADSTNVCSQTVDRLFHTNKVGTLPLIDDALMSTAPGGCNAGLWNADVVNYFAWKAIYLLDWIAGAAAILLLVYGGILYISSYLSEGNIKKAKGIIQAAIIGLVIVVTARYIIAVALVFYSDNSSVKSLVEPPTSYFPDSHTPWVIT